MMLQRQQIKEIKRITSNQKLKLTWVNKALGKLAAIRDYLKNGNKIKAEHIKQKNVGIVIGYRRKRNAK